MCPEKKEVGKTLQETPKEAKRIKNYDQEVLESGIETKRP